MDQDFEYPFVEACHQARVSIKGKRYTIDPYKALYTLAEVAALLPYQLSTIRKFAYGTLPNSPIEFVRDKNRRWCATRESLIRYFAELKTSSVAA